MSSADISQTSMLDLFRTEAECQAQALTVGLLALERDPVAADQLESCMRAARAAKAILFLFGMLTVMTPFKVFPQRPEDVHLAAWPAFFEMLGLGPLSQIPKNGQGLNILLQNFWMTIHPRETPTSWECGCSARELKQAPWSRG